MIFSLCNNYYNYSHCYLPCVTYGDKISYFPTEHCLFKLREQNWSVIWSLVNCKLLGNIEENMASIRVQTIPLFRVRSCHTSWFCLNISMQSLFQKVVPTHSSGQKQIPFILFFSTFHFKALCPSILYRRHTEVWQKQKGTQKHEHI